MADVSFYLIECYSNSCSACEMSFLTGKECPRKCVYCRSSRQKKIMYYFSIHVFTRTVRKALNAISDKNET